MVALDISNPFRSSMILKKLPLRNCSIPSGGTIDPTDPGGQFADRGNHYKTAIFYNDQEEKKIAEQSRDELEASGVFDRPIATAIRPVQTLLSRRGIPSGLLQKKRQSLRVL